MRPKIVFSKKCLQYGSWNVEGPERVRKAYEILKEKSYDFITAKLASEDDLYNVHDPEYVWRLKKGLVEDSDTPAFDNIFNYASLAAGGAIMAAQIKGFALIRPPGHHSGKAGTALGALTRGFCYLNNIAIAVKYLNKTTLILDIDGHHGNGTQEIFFGDKKIMFVSLHRYPFYPGSGYKSEENCMNFPLEAECGEEVYLKTLDEALSKIDKQKIEVIAVSAGFDTHTGDLASLGLTEKTYGEIGKRIAVLNKPTFFVLEGGYRGKNVGKDIDALLTNFTERAI